MKLPRMRAGRVSTAVGYATAGAGVAGRAAGWRRESVVAQEGCSVLKKIACGGAFLACGASCALGPEVCVPCLAAVGATDCLSCLLDW
ncbi:MAG TPA: hypothetical protein VF158_17165 [Longimicrobiales bacterium]